MSDNQNGQNNNKKYSIGCVTHCSIIVVALLVSHSMRKGLGWFWIVLLIVMLVCIAFSLYEVFGKNIKLSRFFGKKTIQEEQKYQKKSTLATQKEMEFYVLLSSAIHNNYQIHLQVSLNSIVDKKLQNTFRNELFRTIDFCIADKNTSEPLLLIELNDMSHLRPDRKLRDQKVQEICSIAKIPLITFWTNQVHTVETIKQELHKYIQLP